MDNSKIMGDITKNFNRYEFRCFHCATEGIDLAFVVKLQELREVVEHPIYILSGYRCAKHPIEMAKYDINPRRTTGTHVLGIASDICCPDLSLSNFAAIIQSSGIFTGVGVDKQRNFVHVDTKNRQLVWTYKNGRPVYG